MHDTNESPRKSDARERLAKMTGSPWFWVAFVGLGFCVWLSGLWRYEKPKPPPIYVSVPDFALTDQHDQPFGSTNLDGKLWVANFIFTSCPTICPGLTRKMATLQRRLRRMEDLLHFVSFSVDPENDSPAVLKKYAEEYKATSTRWRFLTGEYLDVERAVVQGFKMPMERDQSRDAEHMDMKHEDGALLSITHGARFVLVDHKRRIRGFYEVDPEGLDRLVRDITRIVSIELEIAPFEQLSTPPQAQRTNTNT